ncbi:hypothetical protein LEP1GSC195_1470 [Leptospira wolbachii serovar Codice str. CDC]|uniref:Uncharacterized protein n=1 Tax=Leptospira wolbachii serovar Codice str. CDC TaxID=1218599 RepID=R9A8B9_9LEPT|nr:hypothetical protein [Leptospira wolbachii]EOQ98269.1 hypothetical protein LEP1GSC195_1470 [Leptospira wolbachii serovar Codice str. CDC]
MLDIFSRVLISKDIKPKKEGLKLLKLFLKTITELKPEYYNNVEPINKIFEENDISKVLEIWDGSPFYLKQKRNRMLSIIDNGKKNYIFGAISIHYKKKTLDNELHQIKNFLTKSSKTFTGEFGYIHSMTSESEFNFEYEANVSIYSNFKNPTMIITSFVLKKYIPNLYWFTILGPTYVNFFGKKRIEETPCFKVIKISECCYGLQLTENLMDLKNNFEYFNQIRTKAKTHLGTSAFFDLKLGRDYKYSTPDFPLGFAEHRNNPINPEDL